MCYRPAPSSSCLRWNKGGRPECSQQVGEDGSPGGCCAKDVLGPPVCALTGHGLSFPWAEAQGRGLESPQWIPALCLETMPGIGADQVAQACLHARGVVGAPGSPERQVWPHMNEILCLSVRPPYAMVGIGMR